MNNENILQTSEYRYYIVIKKSQKLNCSGATEFVMDLTMYIQLLI
jgi:hypothetical protein